MCRSRPLMPFADRLHPHPRALETAQDRLNEKRFVADLGGAPAPYAAVDTGDELLAAVERIGAPGILKTRRDGYDGKGQWRIDDARDAEGLVDARRAADLRRVRAISSRVFRHSGARSGWRNSVLGQRRATIIAMASWRPPPCPPAKSSRRRSNPRERWPQAIAERLNYVGVLTCEFFATADGPVFNEMAPARPQFRALDDRRRGHQPVRKPYSRDLRLAAGRHRHHRATIVMTNLIGEDANDVDRLIDPAGRACSPLRQTRTARRTQDGPCDAGAGAA